MIEAFLFDLDGVLTDTSEYHYQAWKRFANDYGIPFSRQDNEALRGVSRRESLDRLLAGRPVTETQAEEMMALKNAYYLELVNQMTPADLLPGAKNILEELKALKIKRAVVSASKNANLVISRIELGPLVDCVIDGNAPVRSKPFPDLFLLAAKALAVEPAACLVVEDAASGIEAAHAAGMLAIGLGPRERVGMAELVLPSLEGHTASEILAVLEKPQKH
jgi:beta-phosphoglucomutase